MLTVRARAVSSTTRAFLFYLLKTALFLYFSHSLVSADEGDRPLWIELDGYLSADKLESIGQRLASEQPSHLIIQVNSSSGDLQAAFKLASRLYTLKKEGSLRLELFIDEQAVGAAALFPFLADQLYITPVVLWGDIAYGNEELLPTNILRARTLALVRGDSQRDQLLSRLASAMSDPHLGISDRGAELVTRASTDEQERLLVNQHQLVDWGLVEQVVSPEQFAQRWKPQEAASGVSQVALPVAAVEGMEFRPDWLESLQTKLTYNKQGENRIGYIAIEGKQDAIGQSTWLYIKKALDYYRKNRPICIVLKLDTPGGQVFASQQISDALKAIDLEEGIPVIAFIDDWAISAGAMIAYSCRYIACVQQASMGAAQPVLQSPQGTMQEASEKVNSAIRTDFANRARLFGRNPNLAEAMVDKDIILVWRHGEVVRLDSMDQLRRKGIEPDEVITPKDKLLTLSGPQLFRYGVADLLMTQQKLVPISGSEKEAGKWPASKLLLFHAPFFNQIPHAVVDSYKMDWKTQLFVWLASPVISSLLFFGLLMGLYVEFNTPGVGLPGAVALVCLLLIALSSFSLEIANWLELILLLAGALLVALEFLLLPTGGFLAVVGLVAFALGLFGMLLPADLGQVDFAPDHGSLNAAGEVVLEKLALLSFSLILAVFFMVLFARYLAPQMGRYSCLVLSGGEQEANEGYVAFVPKAPMPLAGALGRVSSALRPAGKIIVGQEEYQAISASSSYIGEGEQVRILYQSGPSLYVEPFVEDDSSWKPSHGEVS